jgi:glycolate oxidase
VTAFIRSNLSAHTDLGSQVEAKEKEAGAMDADIVIEELSRIVGNVNIQNSKEDRIAYSYDASAPAVDQLPLCIITPGNRDEIAAVLKLANQKDIPVVPRGAGTGLAGASLPLPNSIVLLTSRLNRILEIDARNLIATVEPGVVTADLANAAAAQGLFYPPDPGSMAVSTIGGNISLNSGGLRGLKYGVTRDFVQGLEVVLPTGEILETGGKCKKDAAGYHLSSLFIGSEGTLGVITQALLRLLPLPAAQRTAVAYFQDVDSACRVVAETIAACIIPVTLELLDGASIRCVEAYAKLGLPTDAGAMLLIEVDGRQEQVDDEIMQIGVICNQNGATRIQIAEDENQAADLKAARRTTLAALARQKPTTILEDVTVPRSMLPEMARRIREIAANHNVEMALFGHAGDGNLHPTAMTDARDTAELERVEAAFGEIFQAALDLGGTITGEHGVGIKKRHVLHARVGAVGMQVHRSLKRTLDPNNILNPGKIFEL